MNEESSQKAPIQILSMPLAVWQMTAKMCLSSTKQTADTLIAWDLQAGFPRKLGHW